MESLGRVQIRSADNGQYWVAKLEQDYSAIVLADSPHDTYSWFDLMKLPGANHVALRSSYKSGGLWTYVSARPDWYGKLQLQAPGSADWITRVGGNETYGLVNVGDGEVAFRLIDPSGFVSAHLDIVDPRAGNGHPLSIRVRIELFTSVGQTSGALVAAIGRWERFRFAGAAGDDLERIVGVAAVV